METKLKLFNEKTVRTAWNAEEEEWYFSVVDVCNVLTDSADYNTARKYWNKLKQRLNEEGSELVTICHQLKMQAADGKMRMTDVLNTKACCGLFSRSPRRKRNLLRSGSRRSERNGSTRSPIPKRRFSAARHTTAKRDIQTSGSVSDFAPSRSERSSPTNGAPAAWKRISNTQYSQTT